MWRDIKKIIHEHSNFLLTTHINPDGDGIGAASALSELLFKMGKHAWFVSDSPIPRKFSFLNFRSNHSVFDPSCSYSEVQVLIIIDTNSRDRIGRLAYLIDRPNVITVCIDHHLPKEPFTPYTAVDKSACSSGAMVYNLYKECGFELNLEAATGIYASILCDTGRFSYASTSRVAHKIADECIKVGVDPDQMYSKIYQQVTFSQFQVFGRLLENMQSYFNRRVVVQKLLMEDYKSLGMSLKEIEQCELEFIHEFTKLIEEVECVILLQELPCGSVRVSARSKNGFNIEKIMKKLGGGGHQKAAGALCKEPLEPLEQKILSLVEEELIKESVSANGYST